MSINKLLIASALVLAMAACSKEERAADAAAEANEAAAEAQAAADSAAAAGAATADAAQGAADAAAAAAATAAGGQAQAQDAGNRGREPIPAMHTVHRGVLQRGMDMRRACMRVVACHRHGYNTKARARAGFESPT